MAGIQRMVIYIISHQMRVVKLKYTQLLTV